MRTRTVTVRGIPETQLKQLRARALANNRSLNGELLQVIASAAADSSGTSPAVFERPAVAYSATATGPAVDHATLGAVCRRNAIRQLAVFGSQARGDAHADSDVDVVVEFEPGRTPGLGIVRVAQELSAAFGGRRVDLVTRKGLSPSLRDRILAESVALYGA